MVQIIRKARLPEPDEVPPPLRAAAVAAASITVREPRPAGFPLLLSSDMTLIEPAVAFLHEHGVRRAHTDDTVRTYAEVLYDWFDTLEQSGIAWADADGADLVAYRNRMLHQASAHTRRPYSIKTINHRVRGVLRFYEWAVRTRWLKHSALTGRTTDFTLARSADAGHVKHPHSDIDRHLFVLRQFESLPRPLIAEQARELLVLLQPPYDLMVRWQLSTGLRLSELLRVRLDDATQRGLSSAPYRSINVIRKGRKVGYVLASSSLLDESQCYVSRQRHAWLNRAARRNSGGARVELFISSRGAPVRKSQYQRVLRRAGEACGFRVTSHILRATFACTMLARLQQLAKPGDAFNPVMIVKVLMGHEHLHTTEGYLRAIALDACVLKDVLDSLVPHAP